MPKAPSSRRGARPSAHRPLAQDVIEDRTISRFGHVRAPRKREEVPSDDEQQEPEGQLKVTGGRASRKFVDPRLSRKILKLAREQQEELEQEEAELEQEDEESEAPRVPQESFDSEDDEQDFEDDDEEDEDSVPVDYGEMDISPEDRALLEKHDADEEAAFDGPDDAPRTKTLADLIMAKIEAAERGETGAPEHGPDERAMPPGINPKVIEVYVKVGELLSRYKSGPLPKAFKIIPSLPAWEDVLYITDPEMWTPHATLAATRIFVSNLKPAQVERFFQLVLLDKIRDEIRIKKKVDYQTYEAIKKALYKPSAFFKGIIFPLCDGGGVTLKEAAIIGSVLTKVSIPVLHSAAALLRLAEMEYTGPTSLFIRILLDKKYALPYKVIDALVYHFLQFADKDKGVEVTRTRAGVVGERRMPVLWHQSLLVFAQRYKADMTPDQKAALLDLIRVQRHPGIEPDIRRELTSGECRGEMLPEPLYEDDDMSI
ncbi:snoRNA-binding rRNA-processing protein [Malassezia cuniculi]|uniref:SnoRNA-binding rRNA-processing protein n=1 Tax=Malassezia cuniculi TaxID=948313 RepID=A0AAF0EVI4_9BASI|nr:snoRNA-binding rRNA-processing protein [Malassezia cuniculi]